MKIEERYNRLTEYLKNKFGERTLKICVDGGFTCPNRDGKKGYGGCIFCSERGSGELINSNKNITEQVKEQLASDKGTRANKFIVYFQNFTNTYDTIENLKTKYDSALVEDRIIGISIGTRPDCINEEVVKLLQSYANKNYYVCAELGLQTSNEKIGEKINRGYTNKEFTQAVEILNKYNIDVVTHIMLGLPGETREDITNTVKFINSHKIQGLKIHSTYVVENTHLCDMYKKGEYTPMDLDEYVENLVDVITHLNPEIVIHRISGDAPKDILVAPFWNVNKMWIMNNFEKRMVVRDLWQGKFYYVEN